jgi:hypothetical protein
MRLGLCAVAAGALASVARGRTALVAASRRGRLGGPGMMAVGPRDPMGGPLAGAMRVPRHRVRLVAHGCVVGGGRRGGGRRRRRGSRRTGGRVTRGGPVRGQRAVTAAVGDRDHGDDRGEREHPSAEQPPSARVAPRTESGAGQGIAAAQAGSAWSAASRAAGGGLAEPCGSVKFRSGHAVGRTCGRWGWGGLRRGRRARRLGRRLAPLDDRALPLSPGTEHRRLGV